MRQNTEVLFGLFADPSSKVSAAACHAANLAQKAAARLACKQVEDAHSFVLQVLSALLNS